MFCFACYHGLKRFAVLHVRRNLPTLLVLWPYFQLHVQNLQLASFFFLENAKFWHWYFTAKRLRCGGIVSYHFIKFIDDSASVRIWKLASVIVLLFEKNLMANYLRRRLPSGGRIVALGVRLCVCPPSCDCTLSAAKVACCIQCCLVFYAPHCIIAVADRTMKIVFCLAGAAAAKHKLNR